jgi:Domain of unknown function (DUF5103)
MMQPFKRLVALAILLFGSMAYAQEVQPPYNIKTISFSQNNENVLPYFRLNDSFTLAFDDLYGNEANYYYTIQHCNYDWTPSSQLTVNDYLQGFDNQRIQNYNNSFNTLQIYSRYILSFPNKFTRILLTGNYIISILNEDREVVFTRRVIIYQEEVSVPVQVKRSRDMETIQQKHNLDFAIKTSTIQWQSPLQNVKVALFQNGRFDNAIYNVKPQYTIANDLIYKYNKETQFWAGNEYWYFDNKDIRNAVNNIARITAGEIYNTILYTNDARGSKPYTYYPDINGNFLTQNIQLSVTNPSLESDYSWVFFKLSAPAFFDKKPVYVGGMFNNYAKTDEYKLEYNEKTNTYEKAIMIKQGFTNYMYITTNKDGSPDPEHDVDGNFYQTENQYDIFVYYRKNNERYDRVIGRGTANSQNIIN